MVRIFGAEAQAQDFFMACLKAPEGLKHDDPVLKQHRIRLDRMDWPGWLKPLHWGKLWIFQENVFFVPDAAWSYTCRDFRFQGAHVGRIKNRKFLLSPLARTLLSDDEYEHCFVCDDLDLVQGLVQGRSVSTDSRKTGMLGFYWKNLKLGWLKTRNGRGFWSDR